MVPELVRYLEEMSPHLRLDPPEQRMLVRELYSHLEERVLDLESRGYSRAEAVDAAVRDFGQPQALAAELSRTHNTGTWDDAARGALPYLGLSMLFALHLWQSVGWLGVFFAVNVGATLYGWWRGKPLWMYPWAGFSLVLPLVSGIIAAVAVGFSGWAVVRGHPLPIPVWALAGLAAYLPLSFGLLLRVMRQVIRRDWLLASLMFLPFPVLARWLLSLQWEGSALVYGRPSLGAGADQAVALIFLGLALLPVLFMRLQRRSLKVAALVMATPPSFLVASAQIPGHWSVPWLFLFTTAAVAMVMVPAALDLKIGRRSRDFRASMLQSTQADLRDF